jgi:predicted RNase H-like HicB family nuclease
MSACTILVERLHEGRYRATCTPFPDLAVVAATEEAARRGLEEAIGRHLTQTFTRGTTV